MFSLPKICTEMQITPLGIDTKYKKKKKKKSLEELLKAFELKILGSKMLIGMAKLSPCGMRSLIFELVSFSTASLISVLTASVWPPKSTVCKMIDEFFIKKQPRHILNKKKSST